MESRVLRVAFSLFVGALFALLVGFGIQTFYPQPLPPTSPFGEVDLYAAYGLSLESYNATISAIAVVCGLVPLTLSLVLPARAVVIADGIFYGGLFTLLYAAGRATGAGPAPVSFAAIVVGLLAALGAAHVHTSGWPARRRVQAPASTPGVERTMLTVLFPLVAGALTAFSVSVGIQAFYPSPDRAFARTEQTASLVNAFNVYERNVGLWASFLAALVLGLSFAISRLSAIAANSLFLGGLLTFAYAAAASLGAGQSPLNFAVIVAGAVLALGAGHLWFYGLLRWRRDPRVDLKAADMRMLAIVFPIAGGVLAAEAFQLGVNAFYPAPSSGRDGMWVRTVSLAATVVAVLLWLASILLGRISAANSNALLLGGLLTLITGVMPAAEAGEEGTVFLALAVAFVVVVLTGYRRFAARRHGAPPPHTPPSAPAT